MPKLEAKPTHIAHVRGGSDPYQSLESHLLGVASLCAEFAAKLGMSAQGELIGLIHDLGKYSASFQAYLQSATGLLNQDEDEDYVDAVSLKGKIDHSTSGAQLIWQTLTNEGPAGTLAAQILSLCVASHHSGLIDCLAMSAGQSAQDTFSKRMRKADERTCLNEVLEKADAELLARARALMANPETTLAFRSWVSQILEKAPGTTPQEKAASPASAQQIGLLVRALFSCLIDADRVDTADFEHPGRARRRLRGNYPAWQTLIERLERKLTEFTPRYPVDHLRADISRHCLDAAHRECGIYTLTVPTGGGKTLASLRFAMHHAREHNLDRVIYFIPYTSIIDQNAQVVRQILEPVGVESGSVVLEHHSNLTPEAQGWRSKILSENWDAPVVYTTTVQLLETLFGAGTRGARRMHQLARAVLIFDEIQSLPVNCVHLFNNAMNFLADHCGSTVVLCTATQPLLDQVEASKGAIRILSGRELMPDTHRLFDDLNRVEVFNLCKPGGWSQDEIVALSREQISDSGSCLVIVNTKKAAQALYRLCQGDTQTGIFHLSTNMCPAHRKLILDTVRARLDEGLPTLCFSTQLIEAGVDVDFGAVIRYAAGLDSIAQAGGRCNRNGRRTHGKVLVVNPRPEDENLDSLHDIRIGRDIAARVLDDFAESPKRYANNLLGPEAMNWYYKNYFFARSNEMGYPLPRGELGREDSLLNLLGHNAQAVKDYAREHGKGPGIPLRQSFMSAAKAFKAIDTPARGIIVPHGEEGSALIADLCAQYLPDQAFELLRRAQQYSVNVMPWLLEKLRTARVVQEIHIGCGIFFLADPRYYSEEYGLSDTPEGLMENLHG
ncbi:MAG: CRISPR-associated helicase Cas3' [Porticoccaceae bacterium]